MNDFATPERENEFTYFGINKGAFTLAATKEDFEAGKAKARVYETSDGEEKTKYEKRFEDIGGVITGFEFVDGKFGEQFLLELMNPDKLTRCKIQMSVKQRYFDSLAKVFKNIDLGEIIKLSAYDFEADQEGSKEKKRVIGMSVFQNGEKVVSNYYDVEAKEYINGFPVVNKEERKDMGDKDYWTSFFLKVNVFLKKEIKSVENTNAGLGKNSDKMSVDDIPTSIPDEVLDINDAHEIFEDSAK